MIYRKKDDNDDEHKIQIDEMKSRERKREELIVFGSKSWKTKDKFKNN